MSSSTSSPREPKIAKYLDMPLQHASDKLLRSMKRGRDSQFLKTLLGEAPRARAGPRPSAPRSSPACPARPRRTSSCSRSSSRTQRFERLGVLPVLGRGGHRGLRHAGQGAAEGHRAALARGDGHPEAHQPRAEQGADRQAARGAGGGREPGDRAPAGGPPRGPGAGDRRAGLHQRRHGLPRASSSPSRSPRPTTTTWSAGWWSAPSAGPSPRPDPGHWTVSARLALLRGRHHGSDVLDLPAGRRRCSLLAGEGHPGVRQIDDDPPGTPRLRAQDPIAGARVQSSRVRTVTSHASQPGVS